MEINVKMDAQQKSILNITHNTESKGSLEMGNEHKKEIWHNRENVFQGCTGNGKLTLKGKRPVPIEKYPT